MKILVLVVTSGGFLIILLFYIFGLFPITLFGLLLIGVHLILVILAFLILSHTSKHMSFPSVFVKVRIKSIYTSLCLALFFFLALGEGVLRGYISILLLFGMLFIYLVGALGKGSGHDKVMFIISGIGILIGVLYGFYTPSFGYDTMRDAMMAAQLLGRAKIEELTVTHLAYPMPIVPILYAILSLLTSLDATWASALIGFAYLLTLPISTLILSRQLVGNNVVSSYSALLTLFTPLVMIWSVMFIPQAYSVLTMILTLFILTLTNRTHREIVLLIFTIALILGHGGVALFFLVILTWILYFDKKDLFKISTRYVILYITIFMVYLSYTTLIWPLNSASWSMYEAILAFLKGEKIVRDLPPTPPTTSYIPFVLSQIPLLVIVATSLVALLDDETPNQLRALLFLLFTMLAIHYIVGSTFPAFDTVRYIAYPSVVLLASLFPLGLQALMRRGALGVSYGLSLIVLLIVAFTFGGSLTPENPYTTNPYSPPALYSLMSHSDFCILKAILGVSNITKIITDWRTGLFMSYLYIKADVNGTYRELYFVADSIRIDYATTRTYLSKAKLSYYFEHGYSFLLRIDALLMPGVFEEGIRNAPLLEWKRDLVFNSRGFILYK
ncbi:hypothetical protein [Pyrobaculum sp.]|uniref:hypothetical protein n=1 Tax=Pyrobaculum sp. TaxID=2004705 RepID=UPI00316391B7